MFAFRGCEADVIGILIGMYPECSYFQQYETFFKSPLSCIHRNVRELCATPDKIIKAALLCWMAVRVDVNSLDEESPCCYNALALCTILIAMQLFGYCA